MSQRKSNTILISIVALAVIIVGVLLYLFLFSPGARYDRMVSEADDSYLENRLTQARDIYTKAALIHPDDPYVNMRLAAIDSILNVRDMQDRYQQYINRADSLFVQGNYASARDYYFEALNIDAKNPYPVDQIKRIEKKLSDSAKAEVEPPKDANFHVVVGVFENNTNAAKMQQQLKKQGKASRIIPRPGNLQAVTWGSYGDIHSAYNDMLHVRGTFPEAWVVYYRQH